MARIDLAKPYEEYLRSQVEKGLFSSITAAAENAISKQMDIAELNRIHHIKSLIEKGESDIKLGRVVEYTANSINEIAEKGKAAALAKKAIKYEVR